MEYDLHELKTIGCFDAVTVRIPARWQCGPDPELEGFWRCCEDGEKTGKLVIRIDQFSRHKSAEARRNFDSRRSIEELAAGLLSDARYSYLESEIVDLDDGHMWKRVFESAEEEEDESDRFRHFYYSFFKVRDTAAAFIHFDLVLPVFALDDPEFRALVAIMDREIRAAHVDPFSRDAPFGPLRYVVLDGLVALNLPGLLKVGLASREPRQWYCYFDPEEFEARLWVMSRDYSFADEEDGGDVCLKEEFDEWALRKILEDDWFESEFSHVPGGALAYGVYDDVEPGDAERVSDASNWRAGPMHNHVWRYLRVGKGKSRLVDFLLMLPWARSETPDLLILVKLLDREIRMATFPGIDTSDTDEKGHA